MRRIFAVVVFLSLVIGGALADDSAVNVQRALSVMGFYDGKPDGEYGQRTAYAVSRLMAYMEYLVVEATREEALRALLAGEIPVYAADADLGDSGETALRVQRRLNALGYLAYAPDGVYGEDTQRAVVAFQYMLGQTPTGTASRETQNALFSSKAPSSEHAALKKGDKGDAVLLLQKRLALLGFFTGDMDGQYGEETSVGVKAFQTYVMSSGQYDSLDSRVRTTSLDGAADPIILKLLYSPDFNISVSPLALNDSGQEVYRLQRRLIKLGYLSGVPDGGYGPDTDTAVSEFKKAMNIKAKDCDEATLDILYSDEAKKAVKPYRVVISLSKQRLYVYAANAAGDYSKLVGTIVCSTGPDALPGLYSSFTRPAQKLLKRENDYIRYVYRLSGELSASSIPYYDKDSFDKTRMDGLGTAMPYGGIMTSLQNAKLIWEKCPAGTEFEIVE